ncbi:CHAT domain-containing protein [Kribbella sp. NBC_01505]|uniref:CHAT domain-containing protein n=1 Tax=Kribbella sp. NBC_01505 TaxID=2903580 RepID=UPI00386FDCE3
MSDVSGLDASVFDPFTASPAELRDWLTHRNLNDGDDVITDVVVPLSGFSNPASTVGLLDRLGLLSEQALSIRLQRAYRTGRNRIGTYRCDVVTALDQAMFWNSLAVRLLVIVLLCTAAMLLGLGIGAVGLLLVLAWPLTLWRGRFAFPLTVAVLGIVAWNNISNLLYFAFAAGVCGVVRLFLWFVRFGLIQVRIVDSPARFLGRGFLTRALWDRNASSVLLAVAKATHEERARAPFFIDDVFDRAPAVLRPVLVQCRALVAIGRLEFSEALRLSEEARELADSAPEAIRGWCALQSGDVLLAAGQLGAAERRWAESVELLTRSRRAAFWLIRAELRLIEAQTADLGDPERCLLGLRTLYDVRRRAVRRGDPVLLRKTENYLLRLMHQAGNTVGVVVQLHAEHEVTQGTVEIGDAIADRVAETLLLATLYLDIVEHPDQYPDDVEVDESDPARYDLPAELADNALRHLSRSAEPLLEAQAYAVLARVRAGTGQREEALGNALESLNVVQRVRYQLPTAQWRAHWLALHAHTYALALELAESDGELVAELLETVRAQAIPLETGTPGALLRAAFDSLLTATGLPLGAGLLKDAVPSRTDPLQTDRTILVSGASWVGGDAEDTIELERELDAMFPRGWYWSFAKVGEWVYHAVRSPAGTWFAERRPFSELEPSFGALLRYLPVEQPDGAEQDEALGVSSADQILPGGSVGDLLSRLFEDLGDALIPLPLRHAAHGELLQIVVAPTASLALIPIAALSLGEGRHLLDVGYVAHLPSVALLAERRSQLTRADVTDEPLEVLAVLAPDTAPEASDLEFAVSDPPLAERTITGPLEKGALAAALAGSKADSVLFLAGHVEALDPDDPGSTGFVFADGPFGLHDLYETTDAGTPRYPIPEQVVLAGCRSIGLYFDGPPGLVDAPEWLGLGAAMVYGGARHVFCTLYDIPDTAHTPRIDRALVDSMRFRLEPARALRAIQRAELDRWLDGRGSTPLVFLAYAYVGLGRAGASAYRTI